MLSSVCRIRHAGAIFMRQIGDAGMRENKAGLAEHVEAILQGTHAARHHRCVVPAGQAEIPAVLPAERLKHERIELPDEPRIPRRGLGCAQPRPRSSMFWDPPDEAEKGSAA